MHIEHTDEAGPLETIRRKHEMRPAHTSGGTRETKAQLRRLAAPDGRDDRVTHVPAALSIAELYFYGSNESC